MKYVYLVYFFVVFFSAFTYSMESEVSAQAETEETDFKYGQETVSLARKMAAFGMVFGGWGFAAGSSKKYAHLPYAARRAPLMVFLASSTMMQLPNMLGFDQDKKRLAAFGRSLRAARKKSFFSSDNPYSS